MKIIKIEADNCSQCKLLDIMLEASGIEVSEKYNVDREENKHLVDELDLMGVPVLLFVDEEGNEVDRITGAKGVTPSLILSKL
jgi:arsenate reductase-like glutaredoxin family protein